MCHRYQKSFTSFLKQEKAMHSSRWKQSHLVDAGDAVRAVGLLSERQQAELEKIPVWISSVAVAVYRCL